MRRPAPSTPPPRRRAAPRRRSSPCCGTRAAAPRDYPTAPSETAARAPGARESPGECQTWVTSAGRLAGRLLGLRLWRRIPHDCGNFAVIIAATIELLSGNESDVCCANNRPVSDIQTVAAHAKEGEGATNDR